MDTYLRLNQQEEQVFQEEIDRLEVSEQESVIQIVTSWMEQGLEQGLEQGRQEARVAIAQRMLAEKLPVETIARVTGLSIEQIQQLQVSTPQNPSA